MQLLKQSRGNTTASCAKVPLTGSSIPFCYMPQMPCQWQNFIAILLRGW